VFQFVLSVLNFITGVVSPFAEPLIRPLVPSHVKLASPSNVSAVALPVIILLSALLLIVVCVGIVGLPVKSAYAPLNASVIPYPLIVVGVEVIALHASVVVFNALRSTVLKLPLMVNTGSANDNVWLSV
jgi:hypothetical protein